MGFEPEVFWLGKPVVSYFQTKEDMKQCVDAIYKIGWKIATRDQLTDAWKQGANWCAAGITAVQDQYYPMYPISEEKARSSGGCGTTFGIQGNFNGTPPASQYPDIVSGINVYGIKPNPDFPETIPANTTAKWINETKSSVLFNIQGIDYIISAFNSVATQYHSPATDPYRYDTLYIILVILAVILFVVVVFVMIGGSKKPSQPTAIRTQ